MDVVASLYGRNSLLETIGRTAAEIFIPLTVGGGIRTLDDIRSVLRAGADKVAINTAAIRQPEFLARYVTRQGNRAMANVNASIRETVAGISVAKNFRQERAVYEEFSAVNAQSYSINIRRGFVLSSIFPLLNTLSGIGTSIIVYFGGLAVAAAS